MRRGQHAKCLIEKADAPDSSNCVVSGASLTMCIRICSITMNGVDLLFRRRAAFSTAFHALTITAVVKQLHVGNWYLDPCSPNSGLDCALSSG
jgi:hypothetical protein